MKQTCILIKTKDNRKFLTKQENLSSLAEYIKTFKPEVYLVENQKGKVLELTNLVAALCDQEYDGKIEFTQIERIHPKASKQRQSILSDAKKIQKFIKDKFLKGSSVSLKELKEKYHKQNITDACLCNHLSSVRKELTKEGYDFKKISAGTYCLIKKAGE